LHISIDLDHAHNREHTDGNKDDLHDCLGNRFREDDRSIEFKVEVHPVPLRVKVVHYTGQNSTDCDSSPVYNPLGCCLLNFFLSQDLWSVRGGLPVVNRKQPVRLKEADIVHSLEYLSPNCSISGFFEVLLIFLRPELSSERNH
jgi:hypothetical protein